MNANKALWEKGDFTQIASFMRYSGDQLARSLQVTPGMRVLDVGCGDGTTAVPLARLGANVLGVDIAENLIVAGRKRAQMHDLHSLEFAEGDACDLRGVSSQSYDLTISIFGAMFAPKPFEVAQEMVRVTKPGGRIVMGNWIPNDETSFVSQLLKISAEYTPAPPDGFISPMLWGVESHILERFNCAGVASEQVSMSRDRYLFCSENQSAMDCVTVLRNYYGPTMNAFEAAERDGRVEELQSRLESLALKHNESLNGGTSIPATYMRVTVQL